MFLIWLLVTTVFLLLWPTKWPQYTVALTVPLSVVAADGIRSIWSGAAALWRDRVAAAHRSRVVGGEGA